MSPSVFNISWGHGKHSAGTPCSIRILKFCEKWSEDQSTLTVIFKPLYVQIKHPSIEKWIHYNTVEFHMSSNVLDVMLWPFKHNFLNFFCSVYYGINARIQKVLSEWSNFDNVCLFVFCFFFVCFFFWGGGGSGFFFLL